jgi:porphobilinogen synthase
MVKENTLEVSNLVYPMFVTYGSNVKEAINSMPGQYRYSLDELLIKLEEVYGLGIRAIALFPKIEEKHKDTLASHSYSNENHYLEAIKTVKDKYKDIIIFSDVAMDPYSSDGHDGIVENGEILNDETLPVLAKMALAQAKAGSDYIAPSDMMDGRVAYLRLALDNEGYKNIGIMSYSAKYASSFYGPFRDALDSAPKAGDKKTYQMDFRNSEEGVREAELDIMEGADIVMIKPALSYLDVIRDISLTSQIPVAAYFVSGEYSMIMAAGELGYINANEAMYEATCSVRRAGARIIFTYAALDLARQIKNN